MSLSKGVRHLGTAVFVIINLGIASAAAAAGLKEGFCLNVDGSLDRCCVTCYLFCDCELERPDGDSPETLAKGVEE